MMLVNNTLTGDVVCVQLQRGHNHHLKKNAFHGNLLVIFPSKIYISLSITQAWELQMLL